LDIRILARKDVAEALEVLVSLRETPFLVAS